MAEQAKKPVKIMETVLRDAHQSLIATRMTTEQMLPIIDKMDKVGYHAVECWGGATFDASLRFLKEDPWERLRKLRDGFKNTKLQMLFRGQNILGYNHYADDVVEYFVQKSIANGIDIIRIFDCFNDLDNLKTAVSAANKEKGHAQVALSYTLGEAYTLDYWKDMAKKIEDMGANSLCIKDMAGLLVPYKATELVEALKAGTDLPIQLHTHYTSGVASMTYLKAVEAGCDIIKIFPGNIVGPAAISSFKGPLPQGEFMPSGGVDVDNVDKWIKAGAYAVGTGSSLTKGAKTGDFAAVTAKAKEFVDAVAAARAKK